MVILNIRSGIGIVLPDAFNQLSGPFQIKPTQLLKDH